MRKISIYADGATLRIYAMPKFLSRPHNVHAFQFQRNAKDDMPDWIMTAFYTGVIQITNNPKEEYVTIYGNGYKETAYLSYWIFKEKNGDIRAMDDKSFRDKYELVKEKRCKDTIDLEEIINAK